MSAITSEDAKRRVLTSFENLRNDYRKLYRDYREVVHENALLNAENYRLRRTLEQTEGLM